MEGTWSNLRSSCHTIVVTPFGQSNNQQTTQMNSIMTISHTKLKFLYKTKCVMQMMVMWNNTHKRNSNCRSNNCGVIAIVIKIKIYTCTHDLCVWYGAHAIRFQAGQYLNKILRHDFLSRLAFFVCFHHLLHLPIMTNFVSVFP